MDDKDIIKDDEFHFTEGEEVKSSAYAPPTDEHIETKSTGFNRRKVLIAIGIIIIAFILYKMIGIFFSPSTKKIATTPSTVATSTTPAVTTQLQSQLPTPTSPSMSTQVNQPQQSNATQQVGQLSNQINSLNNSVQNLSSQVNDLNQQFQGLSGQIQSQQASINILQTKTQSQPQPQAQPQIQPKHIVVLLPPPPPPQWYIQALVTTRAWLVQDNGTTTTVTKGDLLPGYGRITYVSAVHGIVRTSTGAIIHFRAL